MQVLDIASWQCTPKVEIQVYDYDRCNRQDWEHKYSVRKKGLFVKCSLKVARNKSVIRGEGSNNMLGLGGMR